MINEALKCICQSYPQLEGTKILKLLADESNRPILSTVLELVLTGKLSIKEAELAYYHPLGIPLTDYRTLQEIRRRMRRLNAMKAQYLSSHAGEQSPYDAELKALIKYCKECTKPSGAIKNSSDELRRAYRRQYAAIRRLFAKAEADGHQEAVAIVKRNLRLGYSSMIFRPENSS